jgi:ribonuclease BN (tRNA processing enzyme)
MRMHFLGVGSAANTAQHASAVFETASNDRLLIDCGFGVLSHYYKRYGQWPSAAFITHAHLDHIGDLERWYFAVTTQNALSPKLFIPVPILETLHRRLADYPGQLAEGGSNFWDAFRLVPVGRQFWFSGLSFNVWPTRHHAPNSAFALQLPGRFFYTGDTRPIPEILHHHSAHGETIFHDAGWSANPSHTGMDELTTEYSPHVLRRLWIYHYDQRSTHESLHDDLNLIHAGMTFDLSMPGDKAAGSPLRKAG